MFSLEQWFIDKPPKKWLLCKHPEKFVKSLGLGTSSIGRRPAKDQRPGNVADNPHNPGTPECMFFIICGISFFHTKMSYVLERVNIYHDSRVRLTTPQSDRREHIQSNMLTPKRGILLLLSNFRISISGLNYFFFEEFFSFRILTPPLLGWFRHGSSTKDCLRAPCPGRPVYGSSRTQPGTPAWDQAHEVGRLLAAAGFAVITTRRRRETCFCRFYIGTYFLQLF